jgi:hypothetical protein
LAQRLANEAAKAAQHVLTMCVRAIDYCPPVDITFGEFLRAVITADCDVVADDDLNYRIAFLQAFRKRGIFPLDVRTLSVESLLWRGPHNDEERPSTALQSGLLGLRSFSAETIYVKTREDLFQLERKMRANIHLWLEKHFATHDGPGDARFLGVDLRFSFEVRTARIAFRPDPDGGTFPQLVIGLYQEKTVTLGPGKNGPPMKFEGGSTVIADLRTNTIKYCVRKPLESPSREERQTAFAAEAATSLRAVYFNMDDVREPIAAIHRA